MNTERRVEDWVDTVKPSIERVHGADIAQDVTTRVETALREIESQGELELVREVVFDNLSGCVDINFKYAAGSNLNKGAESVKTPLSISVSKE